MENKKIVLVLLAAGNSVRYGGNKLLSLHKGKKMYRHIVDQIGSLPEDTFADRILVTQYKEILADMTTQGYRAVHNAAPELGISHSIHLALDAIRSFRNRKDAVCFAVCDQPDLTAQTIQDFLEKWKKSGKSIGCLSHQGISGNPVIFDVRYIPELYALHGDIGGKRVLKAHHEDVYYHEIPDGAELIDIDTPLKV